MQSARFKRSLAILAWRARTQLFRNIDLSTLRNYTAYFDVNVRKTDKKVELVQKVEQHFNNFQVDEATVVPFFLQRLRKDFEA